MKIKAKKIRIEFNNSSEDYWEASCGSGLEFDEAIRMITRAWEEHDASAEPLIKDEKIRKAVRAWAEAVGGSPVCFYEDTGYEGVGRLKIYREGYPAVFDLGYQLYDLELDSQYTITELCGTPEPTEPTFIDLDERIKEKEGK